MKKIILLSFAVIVIATGSKAQTFVASFGVEHYWNVPHGVVSYVDNRYYDYDWVHTRRTVRYGGVVEFDLILQRGDVFVEISIDNFGRIIRTTHRNYYPLNSHVCDSYCGYHANYYNTYYASCHSHSHQGHNHVTYYRQPQGYAYGHYRSHENHGKVYQHHNNRYQEDRRNDYRDSRKVYADDYPNRRGTYYSNNRGNNHGDGDHDDDDDDDDDYDHDHGRTSKYDSRNRTNSGRTVSTAPQRSNGNTYYTARTRK